MGRMRSVKAKITTSAIICFTIGMLVVLLTLFFYLRTVFNHVTQDMFKEQGYKYANMVQEQFDSPASFLSGICSMVEAQIKSGQTDREALQRQLQHAFDQYAIPEGIAFMMEPNVYDGKDREYIGTNYGTEQTGQIAYYYYRKNGDTGYLPQIEVDGSDFSQPYYTLPKERKRPLFTEPYLYTLGNKTDYMITISYPMLDEGGNVLGVMTVDLYLNSLHQDMANESIYSTGYIVLISEDGKVLYSPDLATVGMDAEKAGLLYELPANGEDIHYSRVKSYVNGKTSMAATIPVELEMSDGRFYVSVVVPASEANAVYYTLLAIMCGIFILVGILIVLAVHKAVGRIIQPLSTMTDALRQVASTGNLTFPEEQWNRIKSSATIQDEIGQSLSAFVRMLEQLIYYGQCLQAISNRDLTIQVTTLSDEDTCGVALTRMTKNLNQMLKEISVTASLIASGSKQLDHASQSLAAGAHEQSTSIEEFSAGISDVRRMSEQNTDTANVTLDEVQQAKSVMDSCLLAMTQMLHAMKNIEETSANVSQVIEVINSIAFETNILALNAAVEAARAGAEGRGFAVVASEVRALAVKSASAAAETSGMLQTNMDSVNEGSEIVSQVSRSLIEMGHVFERNSDSVQMLHTASLQQSQSLTEMASAIKQIATVTQENSTTAEETASSSEDMAKQAEALGNILQQFHLGHSPKPVHHSRTAPLSSGFSLEQ